MKNIENRKLSTVDDDWYAALWLVERSHHFSNMQRSYDHPLNIITNVIGNIDNLESLFLKSIIVHNATFEWVMYYKSLNELIA